MYIASSLKSQKVKASELLKFFDDLKNSGAVGDVYLSWIKYSADALNSKLSAATPPNQHQWPNELTFPNIPSALTEAVNSIITKTVENGAESTDVLGLSFSSLLASIPPLIQRGMQVCIIYLCCYNMNPHVLWLFTRSSK